MSLLRHPPSFPILQPQLLRRHCHAAPPLPPPPPRRSVLTCARPKCRSKRAGKLAIVGSKNAKAIERFISSLAAHLFRQPTLDPLDLTLIALDAAAAAGGRGGGGVRRGFSGWSGGGGWWFDGRRRSKRSRRTGPARLLLVAAAAAAAIAAAALALEKGSGARVLAPAVHRFGGAVGNWRRSRVALAFGFVLGFVLLFWNAAFCRRGGARLGIRLKRGR